jgi:hypothetical protein
MLIEEVTDRPTPWNFQCRLPSLILSCHYLCKKDNDGQQRDNVFDYRACEILPPAPFSGQVFDGIYAVLQHVCLQPFLIFRSPRYGEHNIWSVCMFTALPSV